MMGIKKSFYIVVIVSLYLIALTTKYLYTIHNFQRHYKMNYISLEGKEIAHNVKISVQNKKYANESQKLSIENQKSSIESKIKLNETNLNKSDKTSIQNPVQGMLSNDKTFIPNTHSTFQKTQISIQKLTSKITQLLSNMQEMTYNKQIFSTQKKSPPHNTSSTRNMSSAQHMLPAQKVTSIKEFDASLCTSYLTYTIRKSRKPKACPNNSIITTITGGRLGNIMWAYACVWAVARFTGLVGYVPGCNRQELEILFEKLTVPTLEGISHCPINKSKFINFDNWKYPHQSILTPMFCTMPRLVLKWAEGIRKEFTFKKHILEESQKILHSTNTSGNVYVGVHVRRSDYIPHLKKKFTAKPANMNFFLPAMRYFKTKYRNVTFIVVSDDPMWCKKNFLPKYKLNIRIIRKSRILDLAVMASCNHSIIDYGSYGAWGAILAGGETVYYNLIPTVSNTISQVLPNWHFIEMIR